MHIHLLGICGTFMGGIAQIAAARGHRVTGSDANVYPPMSDHLAAAGIEILNGYEPGHLDPEPDLVLIGNALSRGNPAVEYVLNKRMQYASGPAWLSQEVLSGRRVVALAGTHGKTTTTSMLAWILEQSGHEPGYLIGGLAKNFAYSAALGRGETFVIEADEYDTAFFDKRSKFVHYRPDVLVINNLEYDHADIFPDLASIQRQFHHVIRTVPQNGRIITRAGDDNIAATLTLGCWTPVTTFGFAQDADWRLTAAGGEYRLQPPDRDVIAFVPPGIGDHNALNAAAAIAAAAEIGVTVEVSIAALGRFAGVKRRLEKIAVVNGIAVYDDFAHHPTAVKETLTAMQTLRGPGRILCVLEPRSNTMQLGVHQHALVSALVSADRIFLYRGPSIGWDMGSLAEQIGAHCGVYESVDAIIDKAVEIAQPDDHIVIMSNGGFEQIHTRLVDMLARTKR